MNGLNLSEIVCLYFIKFPDVLSNLKFGFFPGFSFGLYKNDTNLPCSLFLALSKNDSLNISFGSPIHSVVNS